MSGKRDKKRQRRRRADQQLHAAARKERQRRTDDVIRSLVTALKELEVLAADEASAPESFAQRLEQVLSGDDVVASLLRDPEDGWRHAEQIATEAGVERAAALADALCAKSEEASSARWWACGLLCGSDDERRAEEVATATLEAFGPDGLKRGVTHLVVRLRLQLDQPADALDLACSLVEADPSDTEAQHLQALSLRAIAARDPDDHALQSTPCPCGALAKPWTMCCQIREQEAVARFTNRERLYALRLGVGAFIAHDPILESHLDESREEWAAALDDPGTLPEFMLDLGRPDEDAGHHDRELLALERAWVATPHLDEEEPLDTKVDGEDDDAGAILRLYSADEATPPELAVLAGTWQESAICGLWQVADLRGGPNLWLMDIVTGETRWVSTAPEQLDGAGSWSVIAGWLVPDRGVWRSGGAFVHLSPDEGDIAAEVLGAMAEDVANAMLRERRGRKPGRSSQREPKLDPPPAHGILSGWTEGLDPVVARLHHTILGIALPDVVATATEGRRRSPRLRNTDGQPLELLRAIGHADDPAALRAALQRRSDFDDADDDGRIAWRGREMTALEAETSLAEFRALAAERGISAEEEEDGGTRYWVRGFVEIDGPEVTIEVNSQVRLGAISEILARLGVGPLVVDQRFDPSLDMAVPSGWRPLAVAGSPEAEEAWRRRWLDETLPALGGLTPRQAATGTETAVELERLLRQLEFDADLAAHRGQRPLDVERIRRALGEDGRIFEL
jgi:hypothetical protein